LEQLGIHTVLKEAQLLTDALAIRSQTASFFTLQSI
jgi:hypothetical protein